MTASHNPFRAARLEALAYRFTDDTWPALLARLEAGGGRGAIVGPQGAGKTTLMLELADRLAARGLDVRLHQLKRDDRRLPRPLLADLTARHALLLDSAGCLPLWRWPLVRWHARRAGTFVITDHHAGRLPTLCRCRTDPRLLESLTCELAGQPPQHWGLEPAELWARHQGNLRESLRELYDRWPPNS